MKATPSNPSSSDKDSQTEPTTPAKTRRRKTAATDTAVAPTTSLKQIEANRSNAKKSTGPKTASGKKKVSQNPVTHGMLVRASLIREGESKEDAAEFDALYAQLRREHQPQTVLDEYDIERIAIAIKRLERGQRRDAGLRRQALDAAEFRHSTRRRAAVHRAITAVEYGSPGSDDDGSISSVPLDEEGWSLLFQTSDGLAYVLKVVGAVRQDLASGIDVGREQLRRLELLFGRARGGVCEWCAGYHERWQAHNSGSAGDAEVRDFREQVDRVLGREIDSLIGQCAEFREIETLDSQIGLGLHALPHGPDYDTLLRYDKRFTREITQAEASLAQRRAKRIAASENDERREAGAE